MSTPSAIPNRPVLNPPVGWNVDMDRKLASLDARQEEKATRSDDAAVPVHLWDEKLWRSTPHVPAQLVEFNKRYSSPRFRWKYSCTEACPLLVLRHWVHARWVKNIYKDLVNYATKIYGSTWITEQCGTFFLDTAVDAMLRVGRFSFWEWQDGSTLLFWRWPNDHIASALYGYPSWIIGDLPHYRVPQRKEKDTTSREKVAAKLKTVRERRYIRKGIVKSLTSYFAVPKGDSDIRLVYDASKSGLNAHLWSPSFHLPTMDALV